MKQRRKTNKCLNCSSKLDPAYNYCPNCGQENDNRQLSFGRLLSEFFTNYFSLDSRFGRSIKPFFFRPGFLTHQFMDGKRVSYANPIRLYLVVSLIHFFVLSIYTGNGVDEQIRDRQIIDIAVDGERNYRKIDSLVTVRDSLPVEVEMNDSASFSFFLSKGEWQVVKEMTAENYSLDEISDSLKLNKQPFVKQHLTRQFIKILRSNEASIRTYILENIPILMFLLLPLYALIIKLFFSKRLYISHLVHSLHIHSFMFIVLTLYWLAHMIFSLPEDLNILVFCLLTFYIIVSFKITYDTSRWKATYKVLLSGMMYFMLLAIALGLEMIISLLTF